MLALETIEQAIKKFFKVSEGLLDIAFLQQSQFNGILYATKRLQKETYLREGDLPEAEEGNLIPQADRAPGQTIPPADFAISLKLLPNFPPLIIICIY